MELKYERQGLGKGCEYGVINTQVVFLVNHLYLFERRDCWRLGEWSQHITVEHHLMKDASLGLLMVRENRDISAPGCA